MHLHQVLSYHMWLVVIPIGPTVIEGPGGTQAAPAGSVGEIFGNLDSLETAAVTIGSLAVNQAALDVASGRGDAVAIGILESAVLRIEEGEDDSVQADLQTLDGVVARIVVAELDEFLAVAGSAVGILQGSELLSELGQLRREPLHAGLQHLLLAVLIAGLVHQMLAVGPKPHIADRLGGAADRIHGNHDDLIGTQELCRGPADVLLHITGRDAPGTFGGTHVQDVEHGGGMAQRNELTDNGVGQAGVLLLQLIEFAGAILISAGFVVHTFQIPSFKFIALGNKVVNCFTLHVIMIYGLDLDYVNSIIYPISPK